MCAKLRKRWATLAVMLLSLLVFAGRCVVSDQVGISTIEPQVASGGQAGTPPPEPQIGLGFEGIVVPRQLVQLSFSSGGTLGEIMVAEGGEAETGEELVRIDTRTLELSLQQAEATLRVKQLELERARLEDHSASMATAQAELEQAESSLLQGRLQSLAPDVAIAQVEVTRAQEALQRAQNEYNKALDRTWEPAEVREAYGREFRQAELNYQRVQAELERSQDAQQAHAARLQELATLVDRAQAQLDQAVADRDAYTITLDILAAEVEIGQYNLDLARSALNQATLTAPFDGVVAEVLARSGEYVPAGQPVVVFASLSALVVQAEFDEWSITSLRVGQNVNVRVLALDNLILSGKVSSVSARPTFKPGGETVYIVRVALDTTDERLRWGMTAEVEPLP
jgi:HlyD family secretion protein